MTQAPERYLGTSQPAAPGRPPTITPPRQAAATRYNEMLWEVRLCFTVAAACGLIGAAGWLLERFSPGSNSLQALIVVGGFYALMGAVRSLKLLVRGGRSTGSPSDSH